MPPKLNGLEFETDEARFRLADAKLCCDMKLHLATVQEARSVLEPVLRAWEVDCLASTRFSGGVN